MLLKARIGTAGHLLMGPFTGRREQWQPMFFSLPSVLAHARRSESVSSLKKTCVSLHMCPENLHIMSVFFCA
ncbi:hypothetical protein F7725_000844, partial [Dissostichus mawsoni]